MKTAMTILACLLSGCATVPSVAPISDDEVVRLMAREKVQGLALALIDRGQGHLSACHYAEVQTVI